VLTVDFFFPAKLDFTGVVATGAVVVVGVEVDPELLVPADKLAIGVTLALSLPFVVDTVTTMAEVGLTEAKIKGDVVAAAT